MCAYSLLLTASGVGTQSPTWTTAVERKGAVICTPAYARYPFTAGWTGGGGRRQGKKIGQYPSASGGARTHDPWIMSPMHKPLHHQAPHTYIHTYIQTHIHTNTYIHTHIHTNKHTSKSLPVCMDQTNTSKVSCDPAHTTSPLGSSPTEENWTGRGDAKVRKLRYLENTKW